MSETAQTLIKAALRSIGVITSGETPTADELNDGLEAMKFMFRHWSAKNIRLYFMTSETFALTGAASYTIGSGGVINTARPVSIRGAYIRDSNGSDSVLNIIDEARYRSLQIKNISAPGESLWYSPEYPLGKIYIYPLCTGTLYLNSLKALADPSLITSSIAFPPEYDEAIKYNLAVRMAPEYGKEPSNIVLGLAKSGLDDIETRNFAEQMNAARPEVIKLVEKYSINKGDV